MPSTGYHQQVVEQEDFSLVDAASLTSVWIRNLVELTAAHQPAMRHREHLRKPPPPPHTHTHTHAQSVPGEGSFRHGIGPGLQGGILQASCQQPSSPQPGPERRGHRWSAVPISGSAHRWPPEGLWGCPDRYRPLKEAHGLRVRV